MQITLEDIHNAIHLADFDAENAHLLMSPGVRDMRLLPTPDSRQAGVLVLLYPQANDWHIVLTRRTDTLRGHSGQVSFPGGRRDPEDDSFTVTALRETCEELGVCEQSVTIIGQMTPIYIQPSDFHVFPTVGALSQPPAMQPNPGEVAEVFSLSLTTLLDESIKAHEYRHLHNQHMRIPYYAVNGHKVWGATAIMLSELEQRLRVVLQLPQPD